ncbi:MAG: glycosyl hydrolase 115 family protein [Bacteroidaceae bacterium]|nr:glycosyl hydrolase 115 family protein [Bacteroidaceae bacterium]
MKKITLALSMFALFSTQKIDAADKFVYFQGQADAVCLTQQTGDIQYDKKDWKGVEIAISNLKKDLEKVTGRCNYPIVVGTLGKSQMIDKLAKKKLIDASALKGKNEKFIITVVDGKLVIAGSDKRGTIYGIYELSEQIGVSPWYDWADVPVEKHSQLYIKKGVYTDGEPAVKYRGIFLNDEAPALTGWVHATYGEKFNHEFYARVFELVLRLRGNYMWPAMWNEAFYADDDINMQTADDMGVMMGTSHHEPMARAHKEWTRDKSHGAWNYDTNREVLDNFWRGGVERMKDTEDVVTIGMRGNGDEPMGDHADVALLERIVNSQRALIEEATGKPAAATPQVWALYKEVQEYYEKGMKVPDDVILLLCDDNWGNVRILPELQKDGKCVDPKAEGSFATRHPGGYGMYYHVDYVGGPRNTKWINVSQIPRMWEQLQLTYDYGVDKLWILNVGDLKPMEFPIDFWFKMAWNPDNFDYNNLYEYTERFCRQQFGEKCYKECARILNLHGKYVHRRTAELLDARTFNLANGEWKERVEEYDKLERDATVLREVLPVEYRDVYNELIYFPVRAMANMYNMYYAVAMNRYFADKKDAQANEWADKVEYCFSRDAELCDEYNHKTAGGKWNHMMDEIHIGYRSWNNPPRNICPQVTRITEPSEERAELVIVPSKAKVIEADAYITKTDASKASWKYIPDYGIYKGAVALMPYTEVTDNASITYQFAADSDTTAATISIYFAPTFPFNSGRGQQVAVSVDGANEKVININEASKYIRDGYHDQNYQWEITRVNKQSIPVSLDVSKKTHNLTIKPLNPGVVIERIVVE